MSDFSGVLPALVTPFRDGEVDEDALRGLVERVIAGGVSGLVPCGTTGENVTLSDAEHAKVVRTVVEQAKGRVPVVAGGGTVSTRHSIQLSRAAKEAGADGLLLVCPYYNRPTQAGLEAHFRAILAEVSLPAVLYNIPSRTGVDLAVDTLERLADVTDIVAIKEATGNVMRCQEILVRCGERFEVFSGDDGLTLPMMSVGAKGVISVTANAFPAQTCAVLSAWSRGESAQAARQHLALLPVHQAMFVESNPGPVKAVLAARGELAPEVRLPLSWPTEASVAHVHRVIDAAGLAS